MITIIPYSDYFWEGGPPNIPFLAPSKIKVVGCVGLAFLMHVGVDLKGLWKNEGSHGSGNVLSIMAAQGSGILIRHGGRSSVCRYNKKLCSVGRFNSQLPYATGLC